MDFTHADAVRIVSALERDTTWCMHLITEILSQEGNDPVQHLKDCANHNLILIERFEKECGHRLQNTFPDIPKSRAALARRGGTE